MTIGIETTQSRSVSSNARANFIPVVSFRWHNAMRDRSYLDHLSAKYLKPLLEITDYKTLTLDQSLAYRPDKISFNSYQTTDYWWVICFYNKIIHPMRDLYPSRVIRYPSFPQLTQMFQRMSAKESNVGKFIRL